NVAAGLLVVLVLCTVFASAGRAGVRSAWLIQQGSKLIASDEIGDGGMVLGTVLSEIPPPVAFGPVAASWFTKLRVSDSGPAPPELRIAPPRPPREASSGVALAASFSTGSDGRGSVRPSLIWRDVCHP
ncbi:MAG: hypothetical protein ACXVHD_23330, partial [Solirubrobacteraceae bacterium]